MPVPVQINRRDDLDDLPVAAELVTLAPKVERLLDRWPAARPFVVAGSLSIIAGGICAAVTRPTHFELGSWLAAFLVLVGGVATIVLGGGQAWMADVAPPPRAVHAELAAWTVGVAGTIAGSLAAVPILTTVGAVPFVVALALFLRGVRQPAVGPRWPLLVYRALTVVVLVSTPVGVVLAWVRHG